MARTSLTANRVVCVYLAGLVWAVFGQTLRQQFVNFDDGGYVYNNAEVRQGLALQGIARAFTHPVLALWTPLTMISHMVDCQLFGLAPAGHHLVNVLLHMATAILLFLVLRETTGALWRSAFVAAVFAIHPLRVESVAWVSERKDVLSGLFFMLTLGAYVRRSFLLTPLFFALGLLAKPMLVTLPCVLLLLDYWPLKRKTGFPEKAPLFALSLAAGLATTTVAASSSETLVSRAGNALVSCVTYLGQMFFPAGLAALYPFPSGGQPFWKVGAAALLLAALSVCFFLRREKQPYLLTGWLWYLGMLAPVLGIVQMGGEAHADRYTYLPQIGIGILITWAAAERLPRRVSAALAIVAVAALAVCARIQTSYWNDSESLWRRALACMPRDVSALPHLNLGDALLGKGELDAAMEEFKRGLAIAPTPANARLRADCHIDLGFAFLQKKRLDEALAQYAMAVQTKPDYPNARRSLAGALREEGRLDEAIAQYGKALELDPNYAEAHYNLANALLQKGDVAGATRHFERTLQLDPLFTPARDALAALNP